MKSSMETSMTNMVLYNSKGQLQKYRDTNEIFNAYYPERLQGYVNRKKYQTDKLTSEKNILEDKVKYIKLIPRKKDYY